jgi:hypothetical protein
VAATTLDYWWENQHFAFVVLLLLLPSSDNPVAGQGDKLITNFLVVG